MHSQGVFTVLNMATLKTLLVFLNLSVPLVFCGLSDPKIQEKIDEFVNNIMKCRGDLGLTLAVVQGDTSLAKGYGIANIDTGEEVTKDTLFDIGSVSKHFATALLGQLLEESQG